jgi:hypothetical protein
MIVFKRKGYLIWLISFALFCINMFTHNLYTNNILLAYFSGVICILLASIFIKRQGIGRQKKNGYLISHIVMYFIISLFLMFFIVYFEPNISNYLGLNIRSIYYILIKLLVISAIWLYISLYAYKKWHKYIVE